MAKNILHITNDKGGSLEMTYKISNGLSQFTNSKILVIGNKVDINIPNIQSLKIFDEDIIDYRKIFNSKVIKESEIIIQHYFLGFNTLLLFIILKLILKKKVICVFHSNMEGPGSFLRRLYYKFRKFMIVNSTMISDKLVFITHHQMDSFEKFALWGKNFCNISTVIPNCIENSWLIEKKLFKSSSLRVLFVGRLTYFKGKHVLETIIKRTKDLNVDYTIVGEGQLKLDNYASNVYRINKVSQRELKNLYDQHDILIVTSYIETFGMVILEAMARGLVIISSKLPQIESYFKHKKNGFFYPVGDANAAIKFIKVIQADTTQLRLISEYNIKTASRFTCRNTIQKYLKLINYLEVVT